MASGWTNRGFYRALKAFLQGSGPGSFYIALCTAATTPTEATNTLSDLTEIAAGNGYTAGGVQITRDATGWPTLTEDDANHLAKCIAKDAVWTASGAFPSAGAGARWAVLLDDNATVGSRDVIGWLDLTSTITLVAGQTFRVQSSEFDITQ